MSSAASTTSPYTRSAILAWANTILDATHLTFQDIPCHDVGLLLYGVFHSTSAKDAQISLPSTRAATVPLLSAAELHVHTAQHRMTCERFLQLFQFPASVVSRACTASPAPPSAASPQTAATAVAAEERSTSGAASSASAVAMVQQRNAEHVLAMIRALSSEEAELLRNVPVATVNTESGSDSKHICSGDDHAECGDAHVNDNAANVVLLLGPSMTPTAWLSGSAFVEELKLWRWVRLMADRHHRTVPAIRATILGYLQQDTETVAQRKVTQSSVSSAVPAGTEKRRRSDSPVPDVAKEKDGESVEGSECATNDDSSTHSTADRVDHAQELKRARLDVSPSPVPVAATSPQMLLNASVSPLHALLSPHAHEEATNTVLNSVATGEDARRDAADATTSVFVSQATALQNTLRVAQQTLERAFRDAAAKTVVDSEAAGGTLEDGTAGSASVVGHTSLSAIANGSAVQEATYRQRMVGHVFALPADDTTVTEERQGVPVGGDGDEGCGIAGRAANLLTAPPSCAVCPALMAHAVQCNLNAIDALEETRARAITACLKKDPVALLAALQGV
jgi:hypothetical protein